MKKWMIIPFLLGWSVVLYAQSVSISHQVIGSTGASYSGTNHISATCGESIIQTGNTDAHAVTQGFQQPTFKNALEVQVMIFSESCSGAADGRAVITTISGCEPPYNILWSNGSAGESAAGLSAGTYTVSVTSGVCSSELTVIIELESDDDCGLVFYSGITPNGDNVNDYWHIDNIHLSQFADNRIAIFNRWGDEVWTGSGYDNHSVRWEGRGKQGELPEGTYFYVAEINAKVYKGYIELSR